MGEYRHLYHTFEPVYDAYSEILILGSFPSVKSRENQFYYGHPQNRFWKVVAGVMECDVPVSIEEKIKMLLKNKIAIWDVIQECDIIGSSDSSIKNVKVHDLSTLLGAGSITAIYANGKQAAGLYEKYMRKTTEMDIITLPSTSPANAASSLARLLELWAVIKRR